jgi:hypothetical protein
VGPAEHPESREGRHKNVSSRQGSSLAANRAAGQVAASRRQSARAI